MTTEVTIILTIVLDFVKLKININHWGLLQTVRGAWVGWAEGNVSGQGGDRLWSWSGGSTRGRRSGSTGLRRAPETPVPGLIIQ